MQITQVADTQIISSQVKEKIAFKLSAASPAHIMRMFREGIYENPKLAVVREILWNAIDSVKMAGKDPSKHVFIVVPTVDSPNLKIRDEGLGLDDEEMRNIFSFYGDSTKRSTNAAVGYLGIGSKSPFSYSDTFSVTAIKNGVKRVYSASVAKESWGEDGVGGLYLLFEGPTDAPNGVEISVPIKINDISYFKECVNYILFFIPLNIRPKTSDVNSDKYPFDSDCVFYKKGSDRQNYPSFVHSSIKNLFYVVMGDVPYALNISEFFSIISRHKTLRFLYKIFNKDSAYLCAFIKVPLGAIDFSTSRESVQLTDKSVIAIGEILAKKVEEIIQQRKAEIQKHSVSNFDKFLFLTNDSFASDNPQFSSDFFGDYCKSRGVDVSSSDSYFNFPTTTIIQDKFNFFVDHLTVSLKFKRNTRKTVTVDPTTRQQIETLRILPTELHYSYCFDWRKEPNARPLIILISESESKIVKFATIKKRIVAYCKQNNFKQNSVQVWQETVDGEFAKFFAAYPYVLQEIPSVFLKLSDLPLPEKVVRKNTVSDLIKFKGIQTGLPATIDGIVLKGIKSVSSGGILPDKIIAIGSTRSHRRTSINAYASSVIVRRSELTAGTAQKALQNSCYVVCKSTGSSKLRCGFYFTTTNLVDSSAREIHELFSGLINAGFNIPSQIFFISDVQERTLKRLNWGVPSLETYVTNNYISDDYFVSLLSLVISIKKDVSANSSKRFLLNHLRSCVPVKAVDYLIDKDSSFSFLKGDCGIEETAFPKSTGMTSSNHSDLFQYVVDFIRQVMLNKNKLVDKMFVAMVESLAASHNISVDTIVKNSENDNDQNSKPLIETFTNKYPLISHSDVSNVPVEHILEYIDMCLGI